MMGMRALHNGRLGSALSWGLRSKDVSFVTVLAEKVSRHFVHHLSRITAFLDNVAKPNIATKPV